MAGLTDAGSLVFRIKAETDKNSFEEGKKQIDNTSESMNKLIGTARNAAVALVSIKTIGKLGTFADAESSAYKTSKALGITTESLKTWKAAAKIAGVDANSLVNSMGQLGSVISHIKIDGRGLDEYSKKLQEIGLGITDLKDKEGNWLSADKAFQKVIAKGQEEYAKAKTEEEQLLVVTKMGDILGSAGQDFFIALNAMGMTIEQFRQGAGKSVWTTNKNTKDAMAFSTEWNTLSNSLSQIGALFGADVARELTDSVKGINEWLATNGDTIKNALDKIAKKIGGVVEAAVNEHSAENAVTSTGVEGAIKKTKAVFGGDEEDFANWNKAKKEASEIVKAIHKENQKKNGLKANNPFGLTKIAFEELSPELQQKILNFEARGGDRNFFKRYDLQDGIMRPDGTVTKVAPDDWVFAARNLGDLARAFIPPMPTTAQSGNMEFSIVQNFTINGSSDLPQVIRQQAYNGTQEGLMNIMAQSSQRLQLMSGTR